jgi:hypothetical protein
MKLEKIKFGTAAMKYLFFIDVLLFRILDALSRIRTTYFSSQCSNLDSGSHIKTGAQIHRTAHNCTPF